MINYNLNDKSHEIARITVLNNISFITALNLFAEQIAKMNGFDESFILKIQLVIEETAVSIIEHSFEMNETGYYDVIFERHPNKLIIAFEDKGLPYEISQLENKDEGALRMLLIRSIADEIHFKNLGKSGKRIELHIAIPYKNINYYLSDKHVILEKDIPRDTRPVSLMMMEKDKAIELSRCVYRTYGYSYISDFIYFPEKITELLESGLLKSCIAINADGELVAHLGLNFLNKGSKVGETGQAVVDPRYRGRGLFETMKKYLADHENKNQNYGFYSESVSIHPYTQKGNISLGANETGILLGYIPETLFFKKINEEEQSQRQTAILFYMKVNDEPERNIFLPKQHYEIISEIITKSGLRRVLNNPPSNTVKDNHSVIETVIRPEWGQAFLVIKSYGIDFELIIHSKIKEIKNRKIDCIYIDLPLSDKNTPEYTTIMENAGFFFAGIIPELYDGDILRLQYLNNIDIVKDSIITVSDFCNDLLNYVFTERLRVGNI